MEKVICIYHGNCTDGTTAAAVLLTKFPDCILFPFEHGYKPEDLQEVIDKIDRDTTVYIVDFSLKEEDLKTILSIAKEVIIIDHHIGVKETLEKLAKEYKNLKYIFDNNRSGASLTWIYFYGDKNIPDLIKYVEDKDIWTWKYGETTKYINTYLILLTNQPDKIKELFNKDISDIIEKGKLLAQYTDYLINRFIEKAKETKLKIGEYLVRGFNTNLFQSEIGNILSTKFNEAVVLFNVSGDKVKFSFRSCEGQKPTALDLALILGGGGHRHAAGAVVPLKEFCNMIVLEEEQ
jgi:oligoribonuclease NrnB/cAMP/cGMP phosphodiesterase (DHH superfamily)